MKNRINVCFSANRICHHDDYFLLISKFDNVINIKGLFIKIKYLFSAKTIYFLDIDKGDLLFFPFIILRSFWGAKGVAISVRTEYLIQPVKINDLLVNTYKSKFFHIQFKRFIFRLIKIWSLTKIISIHKGHPSTMLMSKYVDCFIYDPQLWDLEFLNFSPFCPPEFCQKGESTSILVAGQFNEQRSKSELLEYLDNNSNSSFHFIIAGKADIKDSVLLKSFNNVTHIDRFLSNEELLFLFNHCDFIYCYYTNNRPSGFFGRAVQLNKPIIVRKGSFLDQSFLNYSNKIVVSSLYDLDPSFLKSFRSSYDSPVFNDSDNFRNLINFYL